MNALIYIFRFIYRLKYWLIFLPLAVAGLIYLKALSFANTYSVSTTIYTGIISGYNAASNQNASQDQISINNAIDNIMNIIKTETTLKNVSMRLYAENMIYGDPKKNNEHILASSYRRIYGLTETHKDVLAIIDKDSIDKTVKNLFEYEKADVKNFVYGLYNWNHEHYCREALSKINVKRLGNSDMLRITYSLSDPGVAHNTLRILNEEFIKQYEELRFGEINDVIAYFQAELDSVSKVLRIAEDSLTLYNISKQVINYDEQTKVIASQSRDFDLKYEEILLARSSSLRLIEEIESRMDKNIGVMKNNTLFLEKMSKITELSSRIASLEPFIKGSNETNNALIDSLKNELATEENLMKESLNTLTTQQYSKEGISSKAYIEQWLAEQIRFQKADAELKVMTERKKELDDKYSLFSPVGSILKRIERDISLKEQTYITVLNSLNDAKMRQKNLQMTSATLKIIDPPIFPINPSVVNKKMLVGIGFFGTFIFLLAFFILLEILDRTLRDKIRTELITTGKVIGALPCKTNFRYRTYYKKWLELASKNLGNVVMDYFRSNRPNIVNVLSTESKDGKSLTTQQLEEYWTSIGLNVKVLTYGVDFDTESREFHIATTLNDLYSFNDEDVIIVEYPSLNQVSIPTPLLKEANINLVATRANRVWKDTDQINFNKIISNLGKTPLFILLTNADRLVVENFTGLLPPYTFMRKMGYRFYQLGLTSKDK